MSLGTVTKRSKLNLFGAASYLRSGKIPSVNLINQMLARCQCHCMYWDLYWEEERSSMMKYQIRWTGKARARPASQATRFLKCPFTHYFPSVSSQSDKPPLTLTYCRHLWIHVYKHEYVSRKEIASASVRPGPLDLLLRTQTYSSFHTTSSSFYPNRETHRHFFLHIYTEKNMYRPWALLLKGIGVKHFGQRGLEVVFKEQFTQKNVLSVQN